MLGCLARTNARNEPAVALQVLGGLLRIELDGGVEEAEERDASARGSIPGIGTNDSSRNSTSAPRVNQSRFLSSVAFEKVESEILAASCSAADAIR